MLSTLPDSYSKQADIHLKLSVQPYHLIPRSPLLICYQMSDQNVGKWKRQQLKMSSFLGNYNHATVSANHPTKWKDVAQFAPERYLLIHHLAAESRKKKGCYLFDIPPSWWIKRLPCVVIFLGVSPQAILHAEEEGSGDVGDRQSLWPPHRVEPGGTHPEGQTPQEPAVWVNGQTTTCTLPWGSPLHLAKPRRSIRYYHHYITDLGDL